ncbi:CaiB/BaiF CoA transferase family protein [Dietzia maris]
MLGSDPSILSGIRVVELAQFYAAPGAGALLGDMGAEVIAIERFDTPSPTRSMRKIGTADFTLPGGESALFQTVGRNKDSVAINLKDAKGRELVTSLVGEADVFLTNFREPMLQNAGLDHATLCGLFPGLVYAKVSGFGPSGPLKDSSGFDFLVQGFTGIMERLAESGSEMSSPVDLIIDQTAGMLTAYGVVAALFHRERTGSGQFLDTSLVGAAMNIFYNDALMALISGKKLDRHSRSEPGNPLRSYYQCADGKWLVCAHNPPARYARHIASMLGISEELLSEALPESEVVATLDNAFAAKSRDYWISRAREFDVVFSAVNSFPEAVQEEQIKQNYVTTFEEPGELGLSLPGFATVFSETPVRPRREAHELGQDTEVVLGRLLGLSASEVEALRGEGVVM